VTVARPTPTGYQNGLRVRMGTPTGRRGVLLRCESRAGNPYWKVRLTDPDVPDRDRWIWPEQFGGILVDGPGDAESRCASCDLRFVTRAGAGELLCSRCDREQFGTDLRTSDPPPARRWNARRRWIRSTR
jgi:hypothetical protein